MYECEHDDGKRNPREKANIFSLITFFFIRHVFRIGIKRDLIESDIYNVVDVCESKRLGDELEKKWNAESEKSKKPSLMRVLLRVYGKQYITIGIAQLVHTTFFMGVKPKLIGKLVAFFRKGQTEITIEEAYVYCLVVVLVFVLKNFAMHNCLFYLHQLAIKMRVAICSLVYRKTLNLSQTSITELSSGRIVTLISKDVHTLDMAILYGNHIWLAVFQLALMTYIIYESVGVAAFVAIGLMLIICPLQLWITKYTAKLRKKSSEKTDERLRLIQEILTTIRIIKMYTWERFYMTRTNEERKAEIKKLRSIIYLRNVIFCLGDISWRLSFYLLVLTYVYLGNDVTAEKIFTVLTCYASLRFYLSFGIPLGVANIAEALVAVNRIAKLLRQPPLGDECETSDADAEKKLLVPSIKLTDVVASLGPSRTIFERMNLVLDDGLVAVAGSLGSGKSSLLKVILKDLPLVQGNIQVCGKVSYASQDPWLFPASLKQNILFGEPYDAERYNKVINMCALRSDIDRLPQGDETTIIDKGLNLSRGQQARVNLARAVYKEADIYLLDDTLSALDANVSRFIFNNCIKDFLRKKLCLIVTHQRQYLKEMDKVLYMRDGKLLMEGRYDEIVESEYGEELVKNQIDFDENRLETTTTTTEERLAPLDDGDDCTETCELIATRNVYREFKKTGKVDWETYKAYFKSGNGLCFFIFVMLLFVVSQMSVTQFDSYVKNWVNISETMTNYTKRQLTNTTEYEELVAKNDLVPLIYTLLIASVVVFNMIRALAFYYFTTTASIRLHNDTFNKVMRATMVFFDTHLAGSILNRFSKDMRVIDEQLPHVIHSVIRVFLMTCGTFYIIIGGHYIFGIYSFVFTVVLLAMRHFYLPVGRSLNRLDGSTRAPIVGHLNASLEGLTTIRASKAQRLLIEQFDRHQNLHTSVSHMVLATSRGFGYYLDVVCLIYVTAIIVTFITLLLDSETGTVGLVVTQALGLSGMVQWGIRVSAEIETFMTSVERVVEYSKAEMENDEGKELKQWPIDGRIEFRDVHLRYANNPDYILKRIDFVVEPKQKIGIIGRTGAGKSSIISVLFRLYKIDGTILIDDQDLNDLKLSFLRSHVSIIPQNPVLFTGTLRSNLDPNGEFADECVWKALEAAHVKEIVDDLDDRIDEGGCNFSIGQRQLLCLARAALTKNKVLILDEATANVDPQTDALIQRTIREKFADCTVLTIAHRLDTVMDSDKILVLDKGRVMEFDSPKNLLNDETSRFYFMAKQAGLVKH